jgi:hypothetical protein
MFLYLRDYQAILTSWFYENKTCGVNNFQPFDCGLRSSVSGLLNSDFELPLLPFVFSQICHRGYSAGIALFFLPGYQEFTLMIVVNLIV